MAGKQKADQMGEVCPYCGKTFKRLKSHLNHCKMAPLATSSRSSDAPSKDALLTASVGKKKKKTASAALQDKPFSSLDRAASAPEVKTKTKSKKSKTPVKKTSDQLTIQTTSTPLSSPQTVSPVPESAYEDTRPLKGKWQSRSSLDMEKDKLANVLVDAGPQSSLKSVALGQVTLAADVLKKAKGRGMQRAVKSVQPPETHTSKTPLPLPADESGLSSPLAAEKLPASNVQTATHMTVQTPSHKHDQHFKPSRSGAKVQIYFPEEVKTSRQVRGKDTTNVKVTDSVMSYGYKVVKTSVWDHIKASLLSRKYGGTIATVSLSRRTITEPVVGKPVRPTLADSDVSVQLPQSFVNTEVAAPLTSEGIKHTDSTRPIAPPPSLSSQARSTQSLYASQGAATSLSPETIEWMSKATAGYVGMKVYRPPGRAPLGHELDWMRPNNEPPELPNPPPDSVVSKVLKHEPLACLNLEHQAAGLSIVPVPLAERRLADVTMSELGPWLVDRIPQSPREGVALVNNSWQWYYRRYIDVRKGGVGGIGMLLAGYCLLSYVWCYPHLKHERWRKYH